MFLSLNCPLSFNKLPLAVRAQLLWAWLNQDLDLAEAVQEHLRLMKTSYSKLASCNCVSEESCQACFSTLRVSSRLMTSLPFLHTETTLVGCCVEATIWVFMPDFITGIFTLITGICLHSCEFCVQEKIGPSGICCRLCICQQQLLVNSVNAQECC